MFEVNQKPEYMGKIKRMDQVKSILRSYLQTGSIKATARQLCISKNTVKTYVRRGQGFENSLEDLLSLSDSEFQKVFYNSSGALTTDRQKAFEEQMNYWLKELKRVGVTKQLLWEEYRVEHPNGYGYSRFCTLLKEKIGSRNLTLMLAHNPGEVMQIDFTGKTRSWVDRETGLIHKCEILVVVLPFSQYTFAIALPSQKTIDFIYGLNQALLYFGRMPKVMLSDNLKSYVTKADRYEPKFNELCGQLGAHYGIELSATRVAKPQDKGSVENAVTNVYRKVFAPLRNEIYHSIEELNTAVFAQLEILNNKPYQKKQGCRRSVFEEFEKEVMRELPSDLFEIKKITKAKVQRNYHVFLGEEKNYYSVPFRYVGKQTTVVYTSKIVEIYFDNQRIALHRRIDGFNAYLFRTEESHMPKSHQEWKLAQGYDAAYFLEQSQKIGAATHWAISQILFSRNHESQTYNSCRGVLHLAKKYSNERLENAAKRCRQAEKVTYTMLRNILKKGLDKPSETLSFSMPDHENIRGAQTYQ